MLVENRQGFWHFKLLAYVKRWGVPKGTVGFAFTVMHVNDFSMPYVVTK
jgi:hypothetical protein